MEPAPEASPADLSRATRPYTPSWVDAVIDWIERLPGPAWAFYVTLWLAEILLVSGLRWLDGSLTFPELDAYQVASTFYGPAGLGLLHFLRRVAESSLSTFRPALSVDDAEYTEIRYRLTTIPAGSALIATGLGLLAAPVAMMLDTTLLSGLAESSVITQATIPVVVYWPLLVIPILLYNTVRQLLLVTRIHQMATHVDLFQPRPLYAFSALSASAGVGLVLFNYYSAITDPATFTNPIWFAVFGISAVVAIAFFVLPLYGMHRRIAAEKDRLEAEAGERIRGTIADLHRKVDQHKLDDADALNKTLSSLAMERQILERMPTWPWQTDTFRGFLTALVLPIILWLVTRALERVAIL